MSLEIIGTGYGRTGTLSTCIALNALGYPCYHMTEVLLNKDNKGHLDFWNRVANLPEGSQHDWEYVFKNYRATVDNPGCCVYQELLEAYPNAKVILTLHPNGPEAWYESTMDTIYFTQKMWQFKVLKIFTPFARKMSNMTSRLIWQRSHRGTMENKSAAIQRYHEHIEEVKAAVSSDKLLIFRVNEGWRPLCDFLECKVPDMDFPNVNDRAQIKKTTANITKGAYVFVGLGGVLFLLFVYALIRYAFL